MTGGSPCPCGDPSPDELLAIISSGLHHVAKNADDCIHFQRNAVGSSSSAIRSAAAHFGRSVLMGGMNVVW